MDDLDVTALTKHIHSHAELVRIAVEARKLQMRHRLTSRTTPEGTSQDIETAQHLRELANMLRDGVRARNIS